MKPFGYQRPATAQEAVALAARAGARYLGGGTNLVDVTGLGLDTVTDTPDGVLMAADRPQQPTPASGAAIR